MTKNTLFFTHIPKCGGNGIHNIFKNIGYDLNTLCGKNCGHKANTKENYLITENGNYPDKDIICAISVRNIKNNPKVINLIGHHVFPRKKQTGDILIASIRNPYDLIVSRWKYHNKFVPNKQYTFEEWVNNFAGETLMRFIENCFENGDSKKEMIVDYFIKLESIDKDIVNLIKLGYLETKYNDEEIKKICSIKLNTTIHKDYCNYYNTELKNKVYESNKLIFDMFGYEK